MYFSGKNKVENGPLQRSVRLNFIVAVILFLTTFVLGGWQYKYFILVFAPWIIFLRQSSVASPHGVFLFFVYLYSATYPTFLILSGELVKLEELLFITNVGIAGILSGLMLVTPSIPVRAIQSELDCYFHTFAEKYARVLLPAIAIFLYSIILASGMNSKRALIDSGTVQIYGVVMQVLFLFATFYSCCLINERIDSRRTIGYYSLLAIFVMLFLGERDFIFRYLFVVIIFYFSVTDKFKPRYYFFALIALLLTLSFTQQVKSLLLTGEMYSSNHSGLEWLFHNEFGAGSRNLHHILMMGDYAPQTNLLFLDLMRFFRFSLGGEDVMSATQWFNDDYRYYFGFSGSSGWGFGIVPEFYLSFGSIGVFLGMFLIGFLIAFLSAICGGGLVGRVFVILLYTSVIYSMRADLANLFALIVKWGLVPYFSAKLIFVALPKNGGRLWRRGG
jgi:hypothetical protein